MRKLKYAGVNLPPIWICTAKEADQARQMGVPFMVCPATWDNERIIKNILYRWLLDKFPYIKWSQLFHVDSPSTMKIEVPAEYRENPGAWTDGYTGDSMDVTENGAYRETAGGMEEDDVDLNDYERVAFDEFFNPSDMTVDIEVLQKLRLLPKFMDDIASAIKSNLIDTAWMDGWNKKLDAPLGRYDSGSEAPNLIILDTSGSIPRGIAATMVSLIDTLRVQANADLIITSGTSRYWKRDEDLPTPEQLSHLCGGCNEARQFYKILNEHILGKHWGNVIVFGDQDSPTQGRFDNQQKDKPKQAMLSATRIDNLVCFHTYAHCTPGYGLWVKKCQPKVKETIDTDWVNQMKNKKGW